TLLLILLCLAIWLALLALSILLRLSTLPTLLRRVTRDPVLPSRPLLLKGSLQGRARPTPIFPLLRTSLPRGVSVFVPSSLILGRTRLPTARVFRVRLLPIRSRRVPPFLSLLLPLSIFLRASLFFPAPLVLLSSS